MPELLGRMFQNDTSRSPHLPGRVLRALAAGTVLALVGCGESSVGPNQANPTMELPPISAAIVAANTEEADNFHFLPPIAPEQEFTTFDPTLSLVVKICVLPSDPTCESPVATFTTTPGSGSETIRVDADEEHYVVNWHTPRGRGRADYRISVSDGEVELGSADVTVKRGRTLPIKFRIEEEIEEPEPTVCDALIAYWPADGTAEDIIGGKNGTLTGGAEFVEGGVNLQAFSFDGISGSVRAPDFSHQGPFTLSLWAKTDNSGQQAFTGVFASADDGSETTFQVDFDGDPFEPSDGNYRVRVGVGTSISLGLITTTGDFQHIAVTWDGAKNVQTYLDGTFVVRGTTTTDNLTIDLAKFGTNRGGGLPFDGLVDEVQIFDRLLTDAEIQDIVGASGTFCKS